MKEENGKPGRIIAAASQKEKEIEYWLKKLSGKLIKTCFPYDYIKEVREKPAFETVTLEFSHQLSSKLMEISKGSDYTMNIILQAGLIALLGKYTGSKDIIIGAPIFKQEIEGDYINTVLVLRNRLEKNLTFKNLLLQVRQTVIEAVENQNYPVELLTRQLNKPYPQDADFPLFDVSILVRGIHDKKYLQHINHNMMFSFTNRGDTVEGEVEYNRLLYDKDTPTRIVGHFKQLLREVLYKPDIALTSIEILTPGEKKLLLYELNDTQLDCPKHLTIHHLFEQQAAKTPDKTAAVYKGKSLKYKELQEKSLRAAAILAAKGVKTGKIVGIMMEPSLEMMTAVFGVLKAGGAYLPLDPGYPGSRNLYMIRDSAVQTIVIHQNPGEKEHPIPGDFPRDRVVVMDNETISPGREFPFRSHTHQNPANPLCIIYNSGPNGAPSGVIIEHRNAVNLVYGLNETIYKNYTKKEEPLRFSLVSPLISGSSLQFLLGTPVLGHTLYIVPGDEKTDGASLTRFYKNHSIDISDGTPTHIRLMQESGSQSQWDFDIKHFVIGGDILPPGKVALFFNYFQKAGKHPPKITNVYGMSEGCVDSTFYEVSPGNIDSRTQIPIGKPLPNQQVYIMDEKNRLQPMGMPGELYVGGTGAARGYLNNPELTLENFPHVPAPFNRSARSHRSYNSHLYRTGDRARWLPGGNIQFLGRVDRQVKIKGCRTEPLEIEKQLLKHPGIKETLVLAKEIGEVTAANREKQLCAYIVPHPAGDLDQKPNPALELRKYLSPVLPGYMIPTYFVLLEKFPVDADGEINAMELPDPQAPGAKSRPSYAPPTNEIEKKLVAIWESVLARKPIGINDDFLASGGDSIKSIQVASRLNKEGYKLNIRDIFLKPTIAQLAPAVEKLERFADQSVITGTVPLTPRQKRFFQQCTLNPHHYNHAVMFYSREPLEEEAIKAVSRELHRHHDALRTCFRKENSDMVQTIQGLDYPLSIRVFDLKGRDDAAEALQIEANRIQSSIDLEKGPLMKVGLFHLDDGHRLLMVIHHLVIDGISWRILFEDIENLMQQYKNKKQLTLPRKTDSFKIWAENLSRYANSTGFLKEKTFWAELESLQVPGIPKDFPGEDNCIKDAANLSFTLTPGETQRLLTGTNKAFGTEINDIFLTALGMSIRKIYRHNRLLIALEGHGREEIPGGIDISRTIGWFTDIYPVVLDISYENDPGRQVKEVKETLRKIPNKGIGYGILRYLTSREQKEEIEFKLNPRIIFNYWGQTDADVNRMTGLEIASEPCGKTVSEESQREYDLEITGIVTRGRLTVEITYNKKHYKPGTIEVLCSEFSAALRRLIDFCSSIEKRQHTPSDFTYKGLSVEMVEHLDKTYTVEDIYTLGPMQEGMLFHAIYEEKSSTHFDQLSYRLHGKMQPPLVEKSLNELFKRHDVLRTVFIYEKVERPIQAVLQDRQVDFYYEDIRHMPAEDKEIFIKEFKEKDKQRSFDLNKDVLMRVAILQVDDTEYEFTWSHHHILIDGWCLGLLIKEFFEIYNSYLENREYRLPPVTPYRNYIRWLEKKDKEVSKRYWQEYLDSYEEQAGIPGIKMPGRGPLEYKNQRASFALDREKTASLDRLAAANYVTLNIVLQAIWGILLAKYNDKEDVVFGAVVSGRPAQIEGVESMIGLFINTIPVRVKFEEKTKFSQLLRWLQDRAIDCEPHHYYPLAEIQAASELKQDLIDHLYAFENYPVEDQVEGYENKNKNENEPGLSISNVDMFEQTNYDFNVIFSADKQLSLRFTYNANVYNPGFIRRIYGHFNKVLDQVTAEPGTSIDRVTILTREEKKWLLQRFNNTDAGYPRDGTIHGLFEKQAAAGPDAVAVVGNSLTQEKYQKSFHISYSELDKQSGGLAFQLKEKGARPDVIIGIIIERSVEMITGILGILKAGGAYLPIDTDYPEQRIQYMIKDSSTKILVTAPGLSEKLSIANCQLLMVNEKPPNSRRLNTTLEEANSINNYQLTINNLQLKGNNLAYIIYTSGTTGRPKGVLIQHFNVVRLLFNDAFQFDFRNTDTWTLFHSYCFDFSVWEMYGALLYGGKLIIIPKMTARDTTRYLGRLQEEQVTVLNQTPSAFYRLMDEELKQHNPSLALRYTIFGGEALKPAKLKKWKARYPGNRLINMFGITETTVHVTYKEIKEKEIEDGASNIGTPIPTLSVYIINKHRQLLPIGVPGELCVGGDGTARGYLNRPGLTAEKFDHDLWDYRDKNEKLLRGRPDASRGGFLEKCPPGRRRQVIYKSGDLVTISGHGNIIYSGRIDRQVKIRGYRVELEEIANQIMACPGIDEAVVVDRVDNRGLTLLAAYLVPVSPGAAPGPGGAGSSGKQLIHDLRAFLKMNLPDYMIPSYFVQLEKIPLTPNGKINRKALPDPRVSEPGAGETGIVPLDALQEKLARIWSGVLFDSEKSPVIGIDDNFFELGGHSLNATMLVARIHKELDVKIPLVEVFSRGTIRELSQYIKKSGKRVFQSIEPLEKKEYYDASYGQKRVWLLSQERESSLSFNISDTTLFREEPGIDVLNILNKVLDGLIQRHESLRTVFLPVEGEIKQQVLAAGEMKFSIENFDFRNRESKEQEVNNLLEIQDNTLFDLQKGPLMKVRLIQIEAGRYFLIFTMHHIISDFLSMEVLTKEFSQLYEFYKQPGGNPLEPLRIQYKDFTAWQKEQLQGRNLERLQKYWSNRLDRDVPVLELPYDKVRPRVYSYKGENIDFVILPDLTAKLKTIANENNATLFMILYASVNVLMAFYTGQTDITMGIPVSGREHPDLENQVGFYLNTLALRVIFKEEDTFIRLLEIVKKVTGEAYEHQMYPFDQLIDDLKIRREPGRHPLFDVVVDMINLTGSPGSPGKLPGEPVESGEDEESMDRYKSRSKFDITIYFFEQEKSVNVTFAYNTDLFEPDTITRMARRFLKLLEGITAKPIVPVSRLLVQEEVKAPVFSFVGSPS